MKLEKLPSGSYRVKKVYKGKIYRVTFDHKPTEREITIALAEKMEETQTGASGSFEKVANEYIDNRKGVVSPSTERTYQVKLKQLSDDFKAIKIYDITSEDVQREVSRLSQTLEPKTVKTTYGFISSVLAVNRPNLKLRVKLPQKIEKPLYEPSSKDIHKILNAAKGTEYSVAFQLAVLSLRRGEICALSIEDLSGNELFIHRTMVYDENNNWIVKENPKTDASNRTITLPDSLAQEIREQGYIYNNHPGALNKAIHRFQKELGIPQFKFHTLRSYFASYAHSLGIPDSDIQSIGGWATDSVMKSIYRKSMAESKKSSMKKFNDKMFK
jgi:integrase